MGPTASGKTGLGVRIAKKYNGEIISADSRQVFRGLDIGTGKDLDEYGDVKYHLIDICEPGEEFNLFDWLALAKEKIADIHSRGKIPVIEGGTGLYVQALTEGFELERVKSEKLKVKSYGRKSLENKSLKALQEIYYLLPTTDYSLDKNNPHRLIRAIERAQRGEKASKSKPEYDVFQVGIKWPKEELNKRIDKRAEEWFREGFIEEIFGLLESGVDPKWLMKIGLDYKIVTKYIVQMTKSELQMSKKMSNEEMSKYRGPEFEVMLEELKIKIHQYAKRQMTWFKRFPEIHWIDGNEYKNAEKVTKEFLDK